MELENILYKKTYKHFRKRLFERYGITVSFPEYVKLHKVKLNLAQQKERSIVGFILINEMAVKVAKSNTSKGKPLVTALHISKIDLFSKKK